MSYRGTLLRTRLDFYRCIDGWLPDMYISVYIVNYSRQFPRDIRPRDVKYSHLRRACSDLLPVLPGCPEKGHDIINVYLHQVCTLYWMSLSREDVCDLQLHIHTHTSRQVPGAYSSAFHLGQVYNVKVPVSRSAIKHASVTTVWTRK